MKKMHGWKKNILNLLLLSTKVDEIQTFLLSLCFILFLLSTLSLLSFHSIPSSIFTVLIIIMLNLTLIINRYFWTLLMHSFLIYAISTLVTFYDYMLLPVLCLSFPLQLPPYFLSPFFCPQSCASLLWRPLKCLSPASLQCLRRDNFFVFSLLQKLVWQTTFRKWYQV